MSVLRLEHCNLRTYRLAETVRFYETVLGMRAGHSPMSPPGAAANWLYDRSGEAAIHLTPVDPADPAGSYAQIAAYRGGDPDAAFDGSGAVDHIAFACADAQAVKARLHSLGVAFAEKHWAAQNFRQIFVKDPNGVTLELNFHEEP